MNSSEPLAVVVVSYNSADLLPGLIDSLGPGLEGLDWRLVVADNDSADDSVEVVRRLVPTAHVVETGRNAGYAAAINAAVATLDPVPSLLVLNPDVRLTPGCGRTLLDVLHDPRVGIAVPLLLDAEGVRIDSMRREPSLLRVLGDAVVGAQRAGRWPALGEMVSDERLYRDARDTDWAEGSTQLISPECWSACGPWDESFFLYSEETDFGLRARDAGFATRFQPAARAVHLEGGSGASPQQWALLVLNRVRLFRRRHSLAASIAFWALTLLRESSRAVLGRSDNRAASRALLSPARLRERPGPESLRLR